MRAKESSAVALIGDAPSGSNATDYERLADTLSREAKAGGSNSNAQQEQDGLHAI